MALTQRQYFDEFNKHAAENPIADVPWIEITTSEGPNVLADLRANASSTSPSPTPFHSWPLSRVHAFYNAHLRPDPSGSGPRHFSSFTFFVIDAACLAASPPQCMVCSDAPDFGEATNEIKLKCFRVDIEEVMPSIAALEMLSMTPSEVRDRKPLCLKVEPQPMLVLDPNVPGQFQLATPEEGRANKRAGIEMAEGLRLISDEGRRPRRRVRTSTMTREDAYQDVPSTPV